MQILINNQFWDGVVQDALGCVVEVAFESLQPAGIVVRVRHDDDLQKKTILHFFRIILSRQV